MSLDGIDLRVQQASATLTLRLSYDTGGNREITVVTAGDKLRLETLDRASQPDVLFLCPNLNDYAEEQALALIKKYPSSYVAVAPHGWMRSVDKNGTIKVKESNAEVAKQFMRDFNLGAGEAEAIALALDNKGSIVATDDRNALRACRLLNLEPTTAMDFLIRTREKNLLTKDEALAKLKDLSKYGRYDKTIIDAARNKLSGGNENAKDA